MQSRTKFCSQSITSQDNERCRRRSEQAKDSQNEVRHHHFMNPHCAILRMQASRILQVLAHHPRRSQSQSKARNLKGFRSLGARGRIVQRDPRSDRRTEHIQVDGCLTPLRVYAQLREDSATIWPIYYVGVLQNAFTSERTSPPSDEHLAHTILYIRTSGNLVKWQKSRRISTTYDSQLQVGSVDRPANKSVSQSSVNLVALAD
jgi:hypothetical protein